MAFVSKKQKAITVDREKLHGVDEAIGLAKSGATSLPSRSNSVTPISATAPRSRSSRRPAARQASLPVDD